MITGALEIGKYYLVDLLVLLVIFILVYTGMKLLGKYDKTGKIRAAIVLLCIKAEEYVGSGNGIKKKAIVIEWAFARYKFLRIFFNEESLGLLIDNIVSYINKVNSTNGTAFENVDISIIKERNIPLR